MKIVSLQSIGLGDTIESPNTGNDSGAPAYFAIGLPFTGTGKINVNNELVSDKTEVVKIFFSPRGMGAEMKELFSLRPELAYDEYQVKLRNNHIMVLPANQYIDEWAPDDKDGGKDE